MLDTSCFNRWMHLSRFGFLPLCKIPVKAMSRGRPKQTRATDILHILLTQRIFFPHCFKHVITRYVPLAVDQQDPAGTDRSHCMREIKRQKKLALQDVLPRGGSDDVATKDLSRLCAALFQQ